MQASSWHDFVEVNDEGRIVGRTYYDWAGDFGALHGDHSTPGSEVESHANGPSYGGSLSNENSGDMVAVNLTAGQTYTWSYRGTAADGVVDPWLRLIGTDGVTVIIEDDDGGFGRTSQITYTATADGTYYLNATSWYQLDPTAPAYQDNGSYTIVQWSPEAGHDAGNSIATTTASLEVGTNYGYLEVDNDVDYYAVELTAGMYYTFTYNGGIASEPVNPGESLGVMGLYNSAGASVVGLSINTAGELGISYYAQTGGTYYLRAEAGDKYGFGPAVQTGGYTIDVREQSLSDMSPLESLNWDSANNVTPDAIIDGVPTVYIYFAPAGVNLTGETNAGWQQNEIDAVMHALNTVYEPLTGLNYVITEDINQATFKMMTVTSASYGARFYPQDPSYGPLQGIGSFNLASGGFRDYPQSLEPGGYSYAVILHEFGHAHGIAHPHDNGGGSEVMPGVTAATGSYGVYDLNQGVYTVMSYNDAWDFHPDGPSAYTIAGIDNGWSRTLGALDVAVMQARYGVQPTNEGNTVYQLTDIADDANYQTIVDTGGNDTIAYSGTFDAQIDLTAATLDYSPTGGGVLSFLYNPQPYEVTNSFLVRGGYTIANGVVIENASGGSGNDVLIGNAANNILSGNDGDDFLMGGAGLDTLEAGNGNDTLLGGDDNDVLRAGNGMDSLSGGAGNDRLSAGNGDDILNGGAGDDWLDGGNGSDRYIFTDAGTDTIFGYQRGEGIDLSGLDVTIEDVTIFSNRIFVDLEGDQDLTIMFSTKDFDEDDLIFADAAAAALSANLNSAGLGGSGAGADYLLV